MAKERTEVDDRNVEALHTHPVHADRTPPWEAVEELFLLQDKRNITVVTVAADKRKMNRNNQAYLAWEIFAEVELFGLAHHEISSFFS